MRGQQVVEVVLFLGLLVLTMVVMRHYLFAAICGRWREAADRFGYGRQYEPGVTTVRQ